jgi:hypothetical protein
MSVETAKFQHNLSIDSHFTPKCIQLVKRYLSFKTSFGSKGNLLESMGKCKHRKASLQSLSDELKKMRTLTLTD